MEILHTRNRIPPALNHQPGSTLELTKDKDYKILQSKKVHFLPNVSMPFLKENTDLSINVTNFFF